MKKFKKFRFHKDYDDIVFYCDNFSDSKDGIRIIFSNREENKRIKLKFSQVVGYRNFDEGKRIEFIEKHPEICTNHLIFHTQNSDFLDWFSSQSKEIYTDMKITHYLFSTPNDLIEVLATEDPVLEV